MREVRAEPAEQEKTQFTDQKDGLEEKKEWVFPKTNLNFKTMNIC